MRVADHLLVEVERVVDGERSITIVGSSFLSLVLAEGLTATLLGLLPVHAHTIVASAASHRDHHGCSSGIRFLILQLLDAIKHLHGVSQMGVLRLFLRTASHRLFFFFDNIEWVSSL